MDVNAFALKVLAVASELEKRANQAVTRPDTLQTEMIHQATQLRRLVDGIAGQQVSWAKPTPDTPNQYGKLADAIQRLCERPVGRSPGLPVQQEIVRRDSTPLTSHLQLPEVDTVTHPSSKQPPEVHS